MSLIVAQTTAEEDHRRNSLDIDFSFLVHHPCNAEPCRGHAPVMRRSSSLPTFTLSQRRSITFYVLGIMAYKFAIEYFNGAFLALASERFGDNRYEKIGVLTGLNYAAQGIGSIIIAPLVKHMPMRIILSGAVVAFGVVSAMIMVMDAATGGQPKYDTPDNQVMFGAWHPDLMYPIFTIAGLAYGMIELIRRIVPKDIVGCDPIRLKKMDALVHVLYESAGTAGALTSTPLIDRFGSNYSCFLAPALFAAAALFWWHIEIYRPNPDELMNEKVDFDGMRASPTAAVERFSPELHRRNRTLLSGWTAALRSFAKAFYYGGWLCITHRRFVWLIPSYALALYGHRYLEYGVVQIFSKSVLNDSSLAQIIVGGSNLGELLGALSVMLSTRCVPTPIPWLRLDALLLNLVWIIPNFPMMDGNARKTAWLLAPCMIPISFGWAGGDCSLAAYIQATLAKLEDEDDDVSALGAVMAFLYVTYIVIYSSISTALGGWVDRSIARASDGAKMEQARHALRMVGGVHFSLLGVIILAATLIPKGAILLNPRNLDSRRETRRDGKARFVQCPIDEVAN